MPDRLLLHLRARFGMGAVPLQLHEGDVHADGKFYRYPRSGSFNNPRARPVGRGIAQTALHSAGSAAILRLTPSASPPFFRSRVLINPLDPWPAIHDVETNSCRHSQ